MAQRKLSFRAWDKLRKEMNYKVLVGNTDKNDSNYTCNEIYDNSIEIWVNADEKTIEIMQSTGVFDKSGKEIFEGDIVSFEDDPGGVVRWNSDFSCWVYWECSKLNDAGEVFDWSQLRKENTKNYIIRGNIYENPDLIAKYQIDIN
jgi:uncharacterized phage protein (TIGR01671 family)